MVENKAQVSAGRIIMSKLIVKSRLQRLYMHMQHHGIAYLFIAFVAWYVVEVYGG